MGMLKEKCSVLQSFRKGLTQKYKKCKIKLSCYIQERKNVH